MENQDQMKEMSAALNARLFLLFLGIMLAVNGLTVSLRNGWGYLDFAGRMEKVLQQDGFSVTETETVPETELVSGISAETEEMSSEAPSAAVPDRPETDEEITRRLLQNGIKPGDLRLMGILCLLQMAAEVIVGLICAILSNRVDKSKITFAAVVVLVSVEAVCLSVQFIMRAMTLSSLLYSVIMPLVLLWAVRKLRRLAKADPERRYAVMPRGKRTVQKNGPDGAGGSGTGAQGRTSNGSSYGSSSGRSLRDRAMMHVDDESPEDEEAGEDLEETKEEETQENQDDGTV